MESWSSWCQDIVWLKTYNIMQKASKLINFTLNLDIRSGIFLEEWIMLIDLLL